MNDEQYCKDIAAPVGSTLHYALFKQPNEIKQGITALFAFSRDIQKITEEHREIDIAKTKLHWWKTEITALYNGKPSHPISLALSPFLEKYQLPMPLLLEFLDGALTKIDADHFCTDQDLELFCYRELGIIYILCCYFLVNEPARLFTFANELAIAVNLVRMIGDYRHFERLNKTVFPLSYDDSVFDKNIKKLAKKAFKHYLKAFKQLPPADYLAVAPLINLGQLSFALLNELANDNYPVKEKQYALTPLRKFLIVWKTRRNLKKGKNPIK